MKQILTILLLLVMVSACKKTTTQPNQKSTTIHAYEGGYVHDWITNPVYPHEEHDVTDCNITYVSGNIYTMSQINHFSNYLFNVTLSGNTFTIRDSVNDFRGKWIIYGFATVTGNQLAFNYKVDTATYDPNYNSVHTQTYTKK